MNPPLECQTSFLEDEAEKVTSEAQAANLQKDWIYNQGMDTMGGKVRGQESTGWASKEDPTPPPSRVLPEDSSKETSGWGTGAEVQTTKGLSPMWRKQDPIQRAGRGALLSTVMCTY